MFFEATAMTYHGRVKNGVIVLIPPASLPEGTEVAVSQVAEENAPTWAEVFKEIIGKAEGFPPDFSRQHDHYLYGTSKE